MPKGCHPIFGVYNASAGTLTQTSAEGRVVVAHLDDHDRITQLDVPGVAESARTFYDSRGRIDRVEQGTGAGLRRVSYAYSSTSGYLESITDSMNRVIRFERDEAGRVTKQIFPDLREIGIAYDGSGNVTSVTPPTRPAHAFGYTPFDQLETYTPPAAGFTPRATTYAYNLDGQVTSITRPDGQQLLPTYEASGRLDYVTIPGGAIDTSYDTAGRVSAVSDPGGVSQSFTYSGPLVTGMSTAGPVPGSVGFAYNNDFAVTSRTVNGASSVAYTYDDDGLLTQAGGLVLGRSAGSGFLETTTLDGTTDSRTRTDFAELETYSAAANGASVYGFSLERDLQGRITAKTETIEGATTFWEYTYHAQRGWLTEVKRDGLVVESYGYDDNGNRTSWSDFWGSGAATYDDQDRMLTAGARTYTYTKNGELLTKTAGSDLTSYTYDVRGALTAVTLPTGIAVTYVVDPGGRRIGKRVNGTLVKGWIYASGLSPVAETDGAGAVTSTFVYATKGNVPDYMVKGGITYRIFTDHLGSVRLVVNATSGAIAQRIDYDAYGRVMADSSPGFQPFGFAGGIYDPQTGLTRFGARDYDPEVGRWTAKDPIGFGGGSAALYGYATNDPVNSTDETGLAENPRASFESCSSIVRDTSVGMLKDALRGNLLAAPVIVVWQGLGQFVCSAAHSSVLTTEEIIGLGIGIALTMNAPGQVTGAGGAAQVPQASIEAQLQSHLASAVERFNAEGFTQRQAVRIAQNPKLARAFAGERIDTFFKESVALDPALSQLEVTPRFKFGADVYDPVSGTWYDVTTPLQWGNHVAKYGPNGVPLYY